MWFSIRTLALIIIIILITLVLIWLFSKRKTCHCKGPTHQKACPISQQQAPHKTEKPFFVSMREKKQAVICRNFNTDGGFWWMIYNVLHAAHFAEKTNMDLIVLFDSGLYVETESKYQHEMEKYTKTNNWFDYFFESLGTTDDQIEARDVGEVLSTKAYVKDNKKTETWYNWERDAFDTRDMPINYLKQWQRVIKIKSHIQDKIDNFITQNEFAKHTVIGIHFRGTDKYGNAASSEDDPVHYEYAFCEQIIKEWQKQNEHLSPFKIMAASDEQPFIEYMCSVFDEDNKKMVAYTDSIRSNTSTSGLHLASHKCPDSYSGKEYMELEDCKIYRELKLKSVHRGDHVGSRYPLGENVLMDVMLLSHPQVKVFFRSAGNVSNFPKYLNPNIQEVHMAAMYKQRHPNTVPK